MPEPLKGKKEYVQGHELRREEDCHPWLVQEVYTREDVQSAVCHLIEKIMKYGMTTNSEHNSFIRQQIKEYIYESFPDVIE